MCIRDRPQVGGRSRLVAPGPLGGDVGRGADEHARGGDGRVALDLGDAEVRQDDTAVLGDQHVGRLHVPVQDALTVRGAQHVEDGEADLRRAPRRQGPVLADHLGEGLALDEFHDDPRPVVLVDHVVHRHRTGVADPRDRLRLTQGSRDQTPLLVLVDGRREPQFLDGDRPPQRLVDSTPDRAHAAPAEHLPEAVTPREKASVLVPLGLPRLLRLRHASPLRSTRPGRAFIVPHPGTGHGAGSRDGRDAAGGRNTLPRRCPGPRRPAGTDSAPGGIREPAQRTTPLDRIVLPPPARRRGPRPGRGLSGARRRPRETGGRTPRRAPVACRPARAADRRTDRPGPEAGLPTAEFRPPSCQGGRRAPHIGASRCPVRPAAPPQRGTMSGAPSRAASAVRSSGCRWDSRSASTRLR